jgi:hypothetical protein
MCTLDEGRELPFGGLSRSEKGRALLDFAIAQVRSASQFAPALLIIEFWNLGLSWETFEPYLTLFARPDSVFQTFITTWDLPDTVEKLGWQVYRIDGATSPRRIVASTQV